MTVAPAAEPVLVRIERDPVLPPIRFRLKYKSVVFAQELAPKVAAPHLDGDDHASVVLRTVGLEVRADHARASAQVAAAFFLLTCSC